LRGGVTRILIIDDDPRPTQPPAGGSDITRVDQPALDGAAPLAEPGWDNEGGRPVVHEYHVPTPMPPQQNGTELPPEADHHGATDVSVVRELMARVEELLHRTRRLPAAAAAGWSGTIRFGSVLVEPSTQTVLRGGQPVRVTHTEFRLLMALMRRRGAIASRIELLKEVWGAGAAVSRRAVDTHIARLRRKLEDDPANPRHILTALAWGYRFRA
jgi:hypothetical protein